MKVKERMKTLFQTFLPFQKVIKLRGSLSWSVLLCGLFFFLGGVVLVLFVSFCFVLILLVPT